ncbi:MAG: hypothetical protein ABIQ16_27240 [Polyangiaceae bacterium]
MRELESLSFDRALRDTARELERRKSSGEPAHAADSLPDVLQDEETWHWLRESRDKDPLAPALEAWLLRLREQAHFAPQRAELTRAQRVIPRPISDPEQALLPLAHVLHLSLSRPRQRAAYLRSYFSASGELGELVRRLWEERQVFAESLQTSLDSCEVASSALLPAARTFVTDTRSAFETLDVHEPAQLVTTLLAESAAEGWPARLTQRSMLDLLGDQTWTHGLRLRPFALPEAHGASSFVLGLAQAGRAICDAASALRSPFVLSTDVFDLRRHSVGALLGMLPLSPAFATRRLGLGPSRVTNHQRALARAALADLRVAAFRILLRDLLSGSARRLRSELPEVSTHALGFELPFELAGVFIRVRPRDSQRFAGALLAASRYERLVQTHDEDWFRNPRAIAELRAELGEPAPEVVDAAALNDGMRAFLERVQASL